jgi:hypothetical protein
MASLKKRSVSMIAYFAYSGSCSSYMKNKSHTNLSSFGLRGSLIKMLYSISNCCDEITGTSSKNRLEIKSRSFYLT